jgi:hypothetical protein
LWTRAVAASGPVSASVLPILIGAWVPCAWAPAAKNAKAQTAAPSQRVKRCPVFIELSSSMDVAVGIAAAVRVPPFSVSLCSRRRFRRFGVPRDW